MTLPNNDVNGEDGTVQAGEYAKGDTATFYVAEGEKGDVGEKEVRGGGRGSRDVYGSMNNKEPFMDTII